MNSETKATRQNLVQQISEHLDPGFTFLPPTIRFPMPVVAHGELGMCAILHKNESLMYDARTNSWHSPPPSTPFSPEKENQEAKIDLSVTAKAPIDRITSICWLSNAFDDGQTQHTGIILSSEPKAAAEQIQQHMLRQFAGVTETTRPWVGGYMAAALGPKNLPSTALKRLIQAATLSLENVIQDQPIVVFGQDVGIKDLMDPSYLLPALVIAASEDWNLIARENPTKTGFKVVLKEDPTALLGYRVDSIEPSVPFMFLGPLIALVARTQEDGKDDFYFDDIINQFGRWLAKNDLDAKILDGVESQLQYNG